MRYRDIAGRASPAPCAFQNRTTFLYVMKGEEADCKDMTRRFGGEIGGYSKLPVIPAVSVEVVCPNEDKAFALGAAWLDYIDLSPHRPHTDEERLAWGKEHAPIKDVPSDWTFR